MVRSDNRSSEYPLDPQFLQRWSPRAFTGEAMPEQVLMTCLEAARWAPSSGNAQPWRFIYANRTDPAWSTLFDLLADGNKVWCTKAAVLMLVASKRTVHYGGKEMPSPTHSLDTGAAWMSLALQATKLGWHAHGMAGFDYARAPGALGIPDIYAVDMMLALGKLADKSTLPPPLQEREAPSQRLPLSEVVMAGRFRNS